MARLWKMFGGEPFMVNPHLGILGLSNPRKKGSKSMTAAQRRMAWVRSHKRNRSHRRKHKRNPFPVGGLIVNRKRRHKRNPTRFARARRSAGAISSKFFGMPPLQTIGWTAGGLLGTPMIEKQLLTYLPVSITSNSIGKFAVKIISVLGLGYIAKKAVGTGAATALMIGGGAYVLTGAIKEFAPSVAAWFGLSAYQPNTAPGMSAYLPNTSLGAASWGARNNIFSANNGGMNVVAGRFRRFQ